MPDVSPTKWHRAHTTGFSRRFFAALAKNYVNYEEGYGYLFNSYYEAVGPRILAPVGARFRAPELARCQLSRTR